MNTTPLKSFNRRRLNVAIALLAGVASTPFTYAQEADTPAIEELVVTGSRIQRIDNATSTQPLSVISAEDLSSSATVDIGEILNENPALLSSVTSTNSIGGTAANSGRASNVGGSALNLRALGSQRTLTLVNGRRHVSGIEGTSSVDVSTIPSALIERVEVLTGGASAVYGADAVTGVVNFVLRNDYEGVDIDFRTGLAEEGDAGTASLRALIGQNFDDNRGNFTVSLQHDSSDGLRAGDREGQRNGGRFGNDVNPALRFQKGDITASNTPNLAQYYNFNNTGLFPFGLRIPNSDTFAANYQSEFGTAPSLTAAEQALFDRAATATPRALLPGRTFNITSPYGVIALGDFGTVVPLGQEPDLDGNGTSDCLDSFTGYNSSLDGAGSFGAAGGCWLVNAAGQLVPYNDGLVAGNFNQFGAEDSYIAPNRPYIIPKDDKYSINLNARYELTPTMELFAESKYVYHEVVFGGGGNQATDYLYGAPDNPFLPAQLAPFANNPGVGFVGPGGLYISRDSDDWGDNESINRRTTYRLVAGLSGNLDQWGLDYELSANYGKFNRHYKSPFTPVTDRFFAAIDVVTDPATGQPVCRSDLDASAYPRTTPFNFPAYLGGRALSPFFSFQPGDGQCKPANIWGGEGSISQEAIDFFSYTRTVKEEIEQSVLSGFVSGNSSEFFTMPAGPISFAFGGEWREEKSAQEYDNYDQGLTSVSGVTPAGVAFEAGDWVGDVSRARSLGGSPGNRALSTEASYDVWDVFAEVEVPLLSNLPLIETLTVDGAFRRADYSTFGESDTFKVGGLWAPIEDVRFRANYSKAVRVPNLFELFSPEQGQSFRPNDPCDASQISSGPNPALRQQNCVTDLQSLNVPNDKIFDAAGNYIFVDPLSAGFPGAIGGNPNLEPEEAITKTLGVVIQPRFVEGLTVSLDYWDIVIEDAISEISSQNIVTSCYDSPTLNNPFCELLQRNAEPTSAQSGGFTFLRQVQLNFGEAQATGVDLNVNYRFDVGAFQIGLGGAVTKQLDLAFIEPSNPGEEAVVDNDLMEMRRPEWSGQLNFNVATGPFSLSLRSQYLSEMALTGPIETAVQNYGPGIFTDEFFSHNLSGNWDYSSNVRLYGGISNVTDEKPYATQRSYPVSPVGRAYYVGINVAL
ncbi:MAG: TonB-dependent receptor [Gammaproteobacteria bacterium]|nr:TonB-dependent receptor [Gammaproteobacteria bacterium]